MVLVKRRRKVPVRAEDLMVRELVTVGPDDTVDTAARKMLEERVGSVLVVDSEGRLRGIVTERDLVFVVSESWDPRARRVWEVMTENPIVVRPGDDLVTVIRKMSEVGVRHLPVVGEDGRPVGIISYRDVLDFIMSVFMLALGLKEEF